MTTAATMATCVARHPEGVTYCVNCREIFTCAGCGLDKCVECEPDMVDSCDNCVACFCHACANHVRTCEECERQLCADCSDFATCPTCGGPFCNTGCLAEHECDYGLDECATEEDEEQDEEEDEEEEDEEESVLGATLAPAQPHS